MNRSIKPNIKRTKEILRTVEKLALQSDTGLKLNCLLAIAQKNNLTAKIQSFLLLLPLNNKIYE